VNVDVVGVRLSRRRVARLICPFRHKTSYMFAIDLAHQNILPEVHYNK